MCYSLSLPAYLVEFKNLAKANTAVSIGAGNYASQSSQSSQEERRMSRMCGELWKHPEQMVQQITFSRALPLCPLFFTSTYKYTVKVSILKKKKFQLLLVFYCSCKVVRSLRSLSFIAGIYSSEDFDLIAPTKLLVKFANDPHPKLLNEMDISILLSVAYDADHSCLLETSLLSQSPHFPWVFLLLFFSFLEPEYNQFLLPTLMPSSLKSSVCPTKYFP